MIQDPEERLRAILWSLADVSPGMPLVEALGYLKAVEARIGWATSRAHLWADGGARWKGENGAAQLARDFSSNPECHRAAKAGNTAAVAAEIALLSGADTETVEAAASSLVAVLLDDIPF